MSHPLLKNCLEAMSRAGNDEAAWSVPQAHRRELLSDPEIGAELATTVAGAREAEDIAAELMVLEALIEAARMDRENAGADGAAFLATLEGAIARLVGGSTITKAGTFLMGRCYVRAGLEPPEHLRRYGAAEETEFAEPGDLPDLDDLLDRLREDAQGDAYSLHAALSEMLATFDPDIRAMLVGEIVKREEPLFARLGCYWLLDKASDIRQAAASAFLRRARASKLDAAIASRLIELRSWLPADAARDVLDQVVKEALRREVAGGAQPRPWTLHRVLASVPDGAGAQSFAIAAELGGRRGVVMLLLKQGFGVKDAYVIPCRSAAEQKRMLAHVAEEIDALDVSPEILDPALAAALAEGPALGEPPAHGLIDVVEICGISDLLPTPMAVEDWIARLDPEGELSRLSKQKLGRLVNSSAHWPDDYDLVQSWFEDGAAVREILTEAITPRSREAALWRHLETRREWWARLIAKTAATLRAEADRPVDDWTAFAATALALTKGRPLRKVPIMSWIAAMSLASANHPWARLTEDPDEAGLMLFEDDTGPVTFSHPAPEKAGELKRVMETASMDITPEWIDGYIAAFVVAPKLVMPSDWLSSLLEQKHDFADHDELQRFLDLVLLRYNAANADLADLAVAEARFEALGVQGLRRWAKGFTDGVTRHRREWTAKSLTGEDKRILRSIANAAGSGDGASELKLLLPAWLNHRRVARR